MMFYVTLYLIIFLLSSGRSSDCPADTGGTSVSTRGESFIGEDFLIVSLLNGDLSCIDISSGRKIWTIQIGGKLLSSSISHLEVIYNGVPTRLVPSLDGSLFRFHNDMFEPLPFTAETLLSSSFKLSQDSTIIGSKELLTLGLDPYSGKIYYKCDKSGCKTKLDHMHEYDVLVVKHMTHTIRAAGIRDGIEKWNFSVGNHDLKYIESAIPKPVSQMASEKCDFASTICPEKHQGIKLIRFSVADGLVLKLKQPYTSEMVWKQQYPSPIAKAWVLSDGHLTATDLLNPENLLLSQHLDHQKSEDNFYKNSHEVPPSLFIGVYEDQVYIQPSDKLHSEISLIAVKFQHGLKVVTTVPRVKWAPYLTSSPSRTPRLNYGVNDPITNPDLSDYEMTALSVFHPHVDYPFDNGFYLTVDSETIDQEIHNQQTTVHDEGIFEEITVQIVSLSFYWKEVVAISLVSAVVLNLILWKTRNHRRRLLQALTSSDESGPVQEQEKLEDLKYKTVVSNQLEVKQEPPPVQPVLVQPYVSRYQSDFNHIQCLGRGGFGVVFHARNILDECEYAVKRITLPNSNDAKEKVTREVKALAKLDHPNIVRYFQSWFETPPSGWQQEQDKVWEESEKFMPTPVNSVTKPQKAGNRTPDQSFVPKLKMESNGFNSLSFDETPCKRVDDSFEIVFDSRSRTTDISNSNRAPFHCYAVAPPDSTDSEQESDNDLTHLDDSGFHKNLMTPLQDTRSFEMDETRGEDSEADNPAPSLKKNNSADVNHKLMSDDTKPSSNGNLFLYIQMQLCKRETLRNFLNANTLQRDRDQILSIFRQISDAVEYIHSQGLIHRDLKPSNIFFSLEDTIKVGDFGLVTALTAFPDNSPSYDAELPANNNKALAAQSLTNNVGTHLYMSPEMMAGRKYDNKVDIYALGLIYFELKYPFSTEMERVLTLQNLKREKYPERFPRELPDEFKFIKWLLTHDAHRRPNITEVINSSIMCGATELVPPHVRSRTKSRSSN